MHLIEVTYNSAEFSPNVQVLLFLRLIGVYVYERFYDLDNEDALFGIFSRNPKKNGRGLPFDKTSREDACAREWGSDAYFYFLQSEDDCDALNRLCLDELEHGPLSRRHRNYLLVDKDNEGFPGRLNVDAGWVILYYEDVGDLLHQIVGLFPDHDNDQEMLSAIAEEYCKKEIWDLNLRGKYFYSAESGDYFEKIRGKYKAFVKSLRNLLREYGYKLGDDGGQYLQYAICNMAYETNLYCTKNKEVQSFWPESIAAPLERMLDYEGWDGGFKDSIRMLLAQVYDDLLKEPNKAYRYYLDACRRQPYNAYAFFKKAGYWQSFGEDLYKAMLYYEQSIYRYPYYYRAWFDIGMCFAGIEAYEEALYAFRNVKVILTNRRVRNVMRPMEIDYLYKAYCYSGYIQYNYFGDVYLAINEDISAAAVWKQIDKSAFFALLDEGGQVRDSLKRRLKVVNLYNVIRKLAARLQDRYLEEEYYEKIQEARLNV